MRYFILFLSILPFTLLKAQEVKDSLALSNNIDLEKEFYNKSSNIKRKDSLESIVINFVRASNKFPISYRNIDVKKEILTEDLAPDVPVLIEGSSPSIFSSTDSGNGVGYTSLRMRGSDLTRINVNINGVPYNDSESQAVFFVDIANIISNAKSIQIQRGVGTSVNGSGSFGGMISILSDSAEDQEDFSGEASISYGSYNTNRNFIKINSKKIGPLKILGSFGFTNSDGYVDRAFSNLYSYYLSNDLSFDKNSNLRLVLFGGKEKTYQSWGGVDLSTMKQRRTTNFQGMRSDGTFYDDQTDNYIQNHYQLIYSQKFLTDSKLNVTLNYTRGVGFYNEYKESQKLIEYKLTTDASITSDLTRKLWLKNDFFHGSLNFETGFSSFNIYSGLSYSHYLGDHIGEVSEVINKALKINGQDYYKDNGTKKEITVYNKLIYSISKMDVFTDFQYRKVLHSGIISNDYGSLLAKEKSFDNDLNFINPKIGIVFNINDELNTYVSYGIAQKEPVRYDYVYSGKNNPKLEALQNIEFGANYNIKKIIDLELQLNGYYMDYSNQLVQSGSINSVGEALRENSAGYRLGVEFYARYVFADLEIESSFAVSKNKNKNYINQNVNYGNTTMAYSPSIISNNSVRLGLWVSASSEIYFKWSSKFVGDQFITNKQNNDHKINSYHINNLLLSYEIRGNSISVAKGEKNNKLVLTLQVNNIFDQDYETYAYVYQDTNGQETAYYFPQSDINWMLGLKFCF